MTLPNDNAYPSSYVEEYGDNGGRTTRIHTGLTIREYFAAKAMHGLVANNFSPQGFQNGDVDGLAFVAVMSADALIKALNIPNDQPTF